MDILLDTQILLWAINGDKRLTQKNSKIFLDPENNLHFSIAGYWEIAIKVSIGKLKLSEQWPKIIQREMQRNFIKLLPITMEHCNCIAELPFHHRDPFDRILVAQAQIEEMTLLSTDNQLKKYAIKVIS
jgi:PIN domain nuclease of toxin-antitoxin system